MENRPDFYQSVLPKYFNIIYKKMLNEKEKNI